MTIVQGDNKRVIPINTGLNLTEATVKVNVNRGGEIFTKIANVLDAESGKCELVLYSSDLTVGGTYRYQWTAEYENGTSISEKPSEFYVAEKITGVAPILSGDPGIINVTIDGGEF
jgi:hypothetical protein